MAIVRPFRALRPRPDLAARVAAVPYDVVDRDEAAALAAGDPWSFLHVTRPEIDLPPATDPYDPAVYAAGAAALERLVEEGALADDPEPALFLYRQVFGDRAQVAVVATCAVDEYDAGTIRKHEKTRADKEDDRTRHALALRAHAGPVFLTYRGRPEIDRRVAGLVATAAPLYDFVAADGVGHTVWRVPDPEPFVAAFAEVPELYIADGHHRAASASRARAAVSRAGGTSEADFFLAALFPAGQLGILPYNRIVHDLSGLDPAAFLARVAGRMEVADGEHLRPGGVPPGPGRFAMYLDGRWFDLAARPEHIAQDDPVARLDAAILQADLLAPVLGIDDPRTSTRIEFVGGIRGVGELVRRVDARPGSVAFSLHPLSVDDLMAVADAGRVLPPKSTWFEPKLRSGLLIHRF